MPGAGRRGTRRELAYWTGQAGDSAAARDQVAALLPVHVHVRVLGAEHPDTLDARHSLAYWTGEAGAFFATLGADWRLTAAQRARLAPTSPRH